MKRTKPGYEYNELEDDRCGNDEINDIIKRTLCYSPKQRLNYLENMVRFLDKLQKGQEPSKKRIYGKKAENLYNSGNQNCKKNY